MIRVDQALCAGCGACVDACPARAIILVDDTAVVDAELCDGCASLDEIDRRLCVEICPNGALTWVAEPVRAGAGEAMPPAVRHPPVEVMPAAKSQRRTDAALQLAGKMRHAVLPAVGGALSWIGHEVVPRLTPLALRALDNALERRLGRPAKGTGETQPPRGKKRGGRGRQRRQRRRGQ